jgi:hypothetical protein
MPPDKNVTPTKYMLLIYSVVVSKVLWSYLP